MAGVAIAAGGGWVVCLEPVEGRERENEYLV